MALSIPDIDIIVISLPTRLDRRTNIANALEWEGLEYKFFDAISPPNVRPEKWKLSLPLWGCSESHIRVLENASRHTLVFEDDADIPFGFTKKLSQCLSELPDDWSVLRLGGAHVRPAAEYSKHLVRSRGALYPHAYLVRNPSEVVAGARKTNIDWGSYLMIQDGVKHRTYAANPWLVNTTGSSSDIPDSVPIGERTARHLPIFNF